LCSSVSNGAIKLVECLTSLISFIKAQVKTLVKGEPDAEEESESETKDEDIKNERTSAILSLIRKLMLAYWLSRIQPSRSTLRRANH